MSRVKGGVSAGLAALAVSACGAGSRTHPPATVTSVARVPVPAAARPTLAVRPVAPKPSPALTRLRDSLTRALRAAGPATGALVYDIGSGRTLFSLRADVARPPASVEKLYTSVAALAELGEGTELQTTVQGAGHLGPGGVWHGDLYLQGGGDPTFGDATFNRVWEDGYGPTAEDLVGQLRRAGIRRVTGRVIGDASLFDARRGGPSSGFAPDINDLGGQLAALTYDHGATSRRLSPGAFAARELVLTLRRAGIKARAAAATGVTPPTAQTLAVVNSPPLSALLRLTDVPSDDFFAEMLTKQLGVRFGGGGTTAAGAAVISKVVGDLGLAPKIVDGSGLSRSDHTSPTQVVALLRSIWGKPTGRSLIAALPVVGVNGTVQTIGLRSPAQGACQAKTGTLNYVTNLAGYCDSRGGHALAFAIFLDGPPNAQGVLLLARSVAAIARY